MIGRTISWDLFHVPRLDFFSFPSSCLGTHICCQAPLGNSQVSRGIGLLGAKQSFAPNWVPKRELGNQ